MTITIAMPVAHIAGTPAYSSYYEDGVCIFSVPDDLSEVGGVQPECRGLRLTRAPHARDAAPALFDVHALTHGYLSLHGQALSLRLPRELKRSAAHNSGLEFSGLTPHGPQLRHVVYHFEPAAPCAQIQAYVETILGKSPHAAEALMLVADPANPNGPPLDWATYRSRHGIRAVAQAFMAGALELLVEAGDVIGNFSGAGVALEIRFHGSCGALLSPSGGASVAPPRARGRVLSPVYFLYLLRHSQNAARVAHLTAFSTAAPPGALEERHPIEHLWSPASVAARRASGESALDVQAASPPAPLPWAIPPAIPAQQQLSKTQPQPAPRGPAREHNQRHRNDERRQVRTR